MKLSEDALACSIEGTTSSSEEEIDVSASSSAKRRASHDVALPRALPRHHLKQLLCELAILIEPELLLSWLYAHQQSIVRDELS